MKYNEPDRPTRISTLLSSISVKFKTCKESNDQHHEKVIKISRTILHYIENERIEKIEPKVQNNIVVARCIGTTNPYN